MKAKKRKENAVTRLTKKLKKQKQKEQKPRKSTLKTGGREEQALLTAFDEWKHGKPVSTLCKELGIHSGHTLTKKFKSFAGSLEQYHALRKAGAGGGHVPFGGKRPTPVMREPVAVSDAAVKRVRSSPRWTLERIWQPQLIKIRDAQKNWMTVMGRELKLMVYVSPSGNRYIRCTPAEKADLIVVAKGMGTEIRLRRYETSSKVRKLKKQERLVKRGLKAQKVKKQAKVKREKLLTQMVQDKQSKQKKRKSA